MSFTMIPTTALRGHSFVVAGLAAGVLAAAGLLGGCRSQAQTPADPMPAPRVQGDQLTFAQGSPQLRVIATEVVGHADEEPVVLTGRVAWDESRTSRVFAPLAGRILELTAVPGQSVRAGQVLARLSAPEYGQAQSDAVRAQADARQAERSLARARELLAAGAVAQRDLESAEADMARAQAELARAQARMKGLGAGPTTGEAAGGGVDQLFALRSPVAGIVVERTANPGQEFRPDLAGPGVAPLFTISDPRHVWAWFDVPESYAAKVQAGQRIDVAANAQADAPMSARIDQVADALDPQSRTLRVRVSLPNDDRHLKAEMFLRGTWHLPAPTHPVVPADAALFIRGRHYTFVQTAPGQFERRAVRVEPSGPGQVTVQDGLQGGERVVTRGALMLQQLVAGAGA